MVGDELVVRGVEGGLTGAAAVELQRPPGPDGAGDRRPRGPRGESSLTYPNAYRISYPAFLDDMRAIGLDLRSRTPRAAARARPSAPRGRRGQRPVESVAIDQAAEIPIVEWVAPLGRASGRPKTAWSTSAPTAPATWTWAELDREADRIAALLLELGVQPGEPVAYQLPNWREFVALTLAALRIGAVCCAAHADLPRARDRASRCAGRRPACWSSPSASAAATTAETAADAGARDRPGTASPRGAGARARARRRPRPDGERAGAAERRRRRVARLRRGARPARSDRAAIAARKPAPDRARPAASSPPAPRASRKACCTATTRSPGRR